MTSVEFDQSVQRLAQYRPFADQGQRAALAIEDLVADAAFAAGGNFASLAACQDGVKTLWGIELEVAEIRTAVESLEAQERCRRDGGGFALLEGEHAAKQAAVADWEAVRATALKDWHELLLRLEPALTNGEFEILCADLETWLGKVVARHGVEAALILYPENPRAQKVFNSLEELGLSVLPARVGVVGAIRDRGLQFFARQPTEAQRKYLAGLLNTSFYLTVLTLDPAASELVQQHVAGHRIYLDTNVLYAVLGLDKARDVYSINRLLELTRSLGYELAVTSWTLKELRTSLESARNRISRRPLPQRELADLMIQAGGDLGNFVTAFWIAYRDRGTQPKDFFDYYEHIETLLETHEIRESTEGQTAVDQDTTGINEGLVLLERFLGLWGRDEVVMKHDVKHRLLVERLRGAGRIRFSNARYWFLTRDSKLPRFGATTIDGEAVDLPFCVSASAWAQVVRAFTPRTNDYDQTIVDLLSTPYVRYRGAIDPRVVEEVVGRIDQFEGADAKLASEVLADTALVREIQMADAADREARVENAFVVKSQELREKLEASSQREAESRAAAATAQEEAELEAARRATADELLGREREERQAEADELRQRLAEEEVARKKTEAEVARLVNLEQIRERQAASRRRWATRAGGIALLLAGVGLLAGVLFAGALSGVTAVVIAICSAAALVFVGIGVAFGRERGGRLVMLVVLAVGFVGSIYTIVDVISHKSTTPAHSRK